MPAELSCAEDDFLVGGEGLRGVTLKLEREPQRWAAYFTVTGVFVALCLTLAYASRPTHLFPRGRVGPAPMVAVPTKRRVGAQEHPVGRWRGPQREARKPSKGLWSLLFDPDLVAVCTDNIMEVGRKVLAPEDRSMAGQIVAASLRKLSVELETSSPEISVALHKTSYDEHEKAAVLALVSLLRDQQVQSIGVSMARQIRASSSRDPAQIRQALEAQLRTNAQEVRRLRREKVPEVVRRLLWDLTSRDQWELTLDPENLQSMGRSSQGELEPTELYPTFASGLVYPSYEKKYFAILGGAIEQGRAFIDILQKLLRSTGPHVTTQVFGTKLGEEALEWPCAPNSAMRSNIEFMKSLTCPLKFGAQGLDALRASKELDMASGREVGSQEAREVSTALPLADSKMSPDRVQVLASLPGADSQPG
jgi:hypothetical protein